MIDRVPSSGSCSRCKRALGLASVKVKGCWYGSATCADGGDCPLAECSPAVSEFSLISRPRRFFRKRRPKELKETQRAG